MKKLFKKKFIYAFIAVSISIFLMNVGYSKSEENVELTLCTISDAYKEWEQLSKEEKESSVMPPMCDKESNNLIYRSFSFDVKSTLPESFDGRGKSYSKPVKNQEQTGGCWAFSTTTALEMYAQKNLGLSHTYSTRHIEYSSTRDFLNKAINDHGYNRSLGSGGNYYMTSSYLVNNYGPISLSEMPFENNEGPIEISQIENKTTLIDVNNVVLNYGAEGSVCSDAQIDEIKRYVYEYGSVLTTIYMTTSTKYYNSTNAAAYYDGSNIINHAITIVGWDDNYSKTNFSSTTRPINDGAWIVQNSYGTSFGKNGYYYVSYEDVHICDFYMVVTDIDNEVEDNSYIHDKLGYIAYMGYGTIDGNSSYKTAYAMNVFTKESGKKENLKEITFGTNGTGSYEVYFKEGNASTTTISNMTKIGSGNIDYNGYVTHKLEEPILLSENTTEFSIVVYYDMDTSTKPIPVSVSNAAKYEYITSEENQSFTSYSGTEWYDLKRQTYTTIASIKAYTDDVVYELEINNYNVKYDENILLELNVASKNIDTNLLEFVVKSSSNQKMTPLNIKYDSLTNLSKISLSFTKPKTNDNYNISVYYDNNLIDTLSIPIVVNKTITSSKYTIDQNNSIIYLEPETTVEIFKANIITPDTILLKNNVIVTSGYVTTGMIINNYTIVVKGDVTGDGLVKMNDVMKISKYIVDVSGMDEEVYQKAADVTSDSYIRMNDVMKISKYIVEGGTL